MASERPTRLARGLRGGSKEKPTCEWTPDDDGIFHTACGHSFYFDGDGGPTEHKQKFCGYCGARLIEKPLPPQEG